MRTVRAFIISLAFFATFSGCGSTVEDCDSPGVDCCTSDQQCVDYYGGIFPYCQTPGLDSGICAECINNEDCDVYQTCITDEVVGGVCAG